jgi:Thaumatin family.
VPPNSHGQVFGHIEDTGETSIAEFSFNLDGQDVYDISAVNGFNLPMKVRQMQIKT